MPKNEEKRLKEKHKQSLGDLNCFSVSEAERVHSVYQNILGHRASVEKCSQNRSVVLSFAIGVIATTKVLCSKKCSNYYRSI